MDPILGSGRSIVHGDLINPDLLNLERRRSNRLDGHPAVRSCSRVSRAGGRQACARGREVKWLTSLASDEFAVRPFNTQTSILRSAHSSAKGRTTKALPWPRAIAA